MRNHKIGIIGSGIAGSSIATFLSKAGFEITVLEKQKNPLPVGSGIMLQPPAIKTLNTLGIKDQIVSNGCFIKGFKGINRRGKTVLDFEFAKVNKHLFGIGVHRGSIFMNLNNLAKESPGVEIKLNSQVKNIEEDKNIVKVTSTTGKTFKFDLVVVANGSGSMLRSLFPKIVKRAQPQNYAALWTTLPLRDRSEYKDIISHSYHKSEYMYGLMPIGYSDNEHKGESEVNFFCAISKQFLEEWKPDKFKKWKENSYKLAPKYGSFIDQIEEFDQMTATQYFDAKLHPFYSGRVAFIGDACHALSPHLSAGSNLALMDALLLSESLKNYDSHEKAYSEYFRLRKQQVKFYYLMSRIITPMFQSQVNWSWIRDNVIPLFYKVPLTCNIMVETIAGIRKNVWGNIDEKYYV